MAPSRWEPRSGRRPTVGPVDRNGAKVRRFAMAKHPSARWRFGRGTLFFTVVLSTLLPTWAVQPKESSGKEFVDPRLVVETSAVPLEEVLDQLPNRATWEAFLLERKGLAPGSSIHAFIDPRTGSAASLVGAFPLLPGRGVGNALTLQDLSTRLGRSLTGVDGNVVAEACVRFLAGHRGILELETGELGHAHAEAVSDELWQVSVPQEHDGLPVRDARLVATINNGNIVLVGTESWGRVNLSTTPALGADKARELGFAYAGGRSLEDVVVRAPRLE